MNGSRVSHTCGRNEESRQTYPLSDLRFEVGSTRRYANRVCRKAFRDNGNLRRKKDRTKIMCCKKHFSKHTRFLGPGASFEGRINFLLCCSHLPVSRGGLRSIMTNRTRRRRGRKEKESGRHLFHPRIPPLPLLSAHAPSVVASPRP